MNSTYIFFYYTTASVSLLFTLFLWDSKSRNVPMNALKALIVLVVGATYLIGMIRQFGVDYGEYLPAFYEDSSQIPDIGFRLLMFLFSSVGLPFEIMMLFMGLLNLLSLRRVAKYFDVSFVLLLVLYFLHLAVVRDFAQLRVGFALTIALLSVTLSGNLKRSTLHLEILKKYSAHIDYWLSEPDNGIYDAMNKGIALSSGDIIGLLNAGDTYLPNALSLLVEQFVPSDNLSIYYGDIYLGYTDANITIKSSASIDRLKYSMTICHQAIFITKHTYLNQGLYNLNYKYASDYAYVFSLLLIGAEFHYLGGVVAYYQTGGVSDNKIFNLKLEYIKIHRNLKSPFLYRALILYIQELLSYYFYKIVGYFFGKQKGAEFRKKRLIKKAQSSEKNV